MKYFKPKSVTWWAGVSLIATGGVIGVDVGYDVGPIADVLNAWTGPVGPSLLIAQGAGLVGIRGALSDV